MNKRIFVGFAAVFAVAIYLLSPGSPRQKPGTPPKAAAVSPAAATQPNVPAVPAQSARIASNASFLIEYMLMLALSPTIDVGDLPVKMWGRYLPDVYSVAIWKLFGITLGREQVDSLVPWSADLMPG